MSHAIAWPEDRTRLLRHGFMETTVYSGREPTEVARDTWETMQHAADLMCLALSEPIMEVSTVDWTGGRMVKVKAAIRDGMTE